MPAAPIDFYFDFSSPYSYIASEQIEELGTRVARAIAFHPILLGAVFRISGMRPLTEIPLKGDYSRRDIARSARFAGVAFKMPEVFPISTVQAARACVVLQKLQPELVSGFIHGAFRAYFAEGLDIAKAEALREVLAKCGADVDAVLQATQSAEIKERLKNDVDESIVRGVFGAPYFIVDGEPFWGFDRIPQMERWLTSGPF
jgi:2-hydroxychromene-2-carboxylate isomerase